MHILLEKLHNILIMLAKTKKELYTEGKCKTGVTIVLIDFDKLSAQDFQLSRINVFHQKPLYREVHQKYRNYNGFLYILEGECRYHFRDEMFALGPGSLVYLPLGSVHNMFVDTPKIEFYRIDFRLEVDGELALFSNVPIKLCDRASPELAEAVQMLADRYQIAQDTVAKKELLCRIFRLICSMTQTTQRKKLAPAINYLLAHLTERVDSMTLAETCHLSKAQFYNLFQKEYAMTPLAYRDRLILRRATLMLRDGTFSVAEIAETLGFESVSYFSRFFKKHKGVSPSGYLKHKIESEIRKDL